MLPILQLLTENIAKMDTLYLYKLVVMPCFLAIVLRFLCDFPKSNDIRHGNLFILLVFRKI